MFKIRDTSEITRLSANPRKITEEQSEALQKSISDNPEYFNARPIILSDRTGKPVAIAGNQRLQAAIALGMDQVPTFLIGGLTEAKEREITVRDNVSNGEWDWDVLAGDWNGCPLDDWGLDVPNYKAGMEENNMTDEDIDIEEEFDPMGTMDGKQRVVFLFDGPEEAESYLKNISVKDFSKKGQAWQVNMSTLSI